jgi:sodium/hydrogen exchanger family protein
MWLAEKAHAEAVLPAFVLGFAVAPTLARHRELQSRFRVVSFALLTPFFFLRAGLNVSLGLVLANLGLVAVLLAAKLAAKTGAVYPLARRYAPHAAWPVALLMSTGLTFGTIASQAGLAMGVITRAQFSVLVCVVVLSAVVPTAAAQALLRRRPVTDLPPAIREPASGYAPGAGDDDEVPAHRPPAPALRLEHSAGPGLVDGRFRSTRLPGANPSRTDRRAGPDGPRPR